MRTLLGCLCFAVAMAAQARELVPSADPPIELDPLTVEGRPPPVPTLRLNPPYPMDARRRWEEGCVVLRFTVRRDGKTDDFAILESKPPRVFERAVIASVFKWRYAPSDEARTVVETFEFRNSHYSTQPRYTMLGATREPIGMDRSGAGMRYKLEMQLKGYSPPRCTTYR
jgi:TonB family protein